jgi:hypothetical protein
MSQQRIGEMTCFLVPLLQANSSVKFVVLGGKLVLAKVLMEYALIAIMYFYYTN